MAKEALAKVRLSLTSNSAGNSEVVRLGGISICSATGCVDVAAPSSVPLSTTITGQSTVIAEIALPYADISSIQFKSLAGQGVLKGSIALPEPLKLNQELSNGDVLVVVQRSGSTFAPIAAASNYIQPEGTSFYYNPTFESTVKLPYGVTVSIPAGALASPQVFVAGVHDTGDVFPLVDLFPVIRLMKPAQIELPAIVRGVPAVRSDQPPLTPRPNAAQPPGGSSKQVLPETTNSVPLKIKFNETGVVGRYSKQSINPLGILVPLVRKSNWLSGSGRARVSSS